MKTPKTLLELQAMFPDEEACWKHLRRMLWPRGFVCPRCGHRRSYPIERRLGSEDVLERLTELFVRRGPPA